MSDTALIIMATVMKARTLTARMASYLVELFFLLFLPINGIDIQSSFFSCAAAQGRGRGSA